MVLLGRIELPTSSLPMMCSTTELQQPKLGCYMPQLLAFRNPCDYAWAMIEKVTPQKTLERKKREAEALKANMKKRKEQAKLKAESEDS